MLRWNHANAAYRAGDGLNLYDLEGDLQIQRRLSALRRRQTHRDKLRYGTHFQDTHLKARRQLHGGDLEGESKLHGCLHRRGSGWRLWPGHGWGRGFVYWSGWSVCCFWHGYRCGYLRKYRLSVKSTWKIIRGLGSRFDCRKFTRNRGNGLLLCDRFNCKLCRRFYGGPREVCARKRRFTRLLFRGQHGLLRLSEKRARLLRVECDSLSISLDRLLRNDRRNFCKLTGC